MSYYSIDDIETDGIKVTTKFHANTPGLGFLLPSPDRNKTQEPNISAGTSVVMPLWLAIPLASESLSGQEDEPILELIEPEALRPDVLNILKSEPMALDLRSQNRLFTHLALLWSEIFTSEELGRILYDTIRVRAAHIFDKALAQQGSDPTMDEYETRLYSMASRTVKEIKIWQKKT